MLEYGLSIKDDHLYCGQIELSDTKVARAIHVDRRAVKATIATIKEREKIKIL